MLERLFRRRARPAVPLVLYTRPNCGLCEEMKREIARARVSSPYTVSEVDISQDPALEEEHGQSIPVLLIGGRKAFKGRLTAADFARKFERLASEWERARALAESIDATRGERR